MSKLGQFGLRELGSRKGWSVGGEEGERQAAWSSKEVAPGAPAALAQRARSVFPQLASTHCLKHILT